MIRKLFNNFIKKFKRESDEEIRKRVLAKAGVDIEEYDKEIRWYVPDMDAQTALNELCDHLLGEDWYVVDPLSTAEVNTIIVYEIEKKYKRVR